MTSRSTHLVGVLASCCLCIVAAARAQDQATDFRPELVDAEFTSTEVRPGDVVSVTFKFRNAGKTVADRDYYVFTHGESPTKNCQNIVIHSDHEPTEPTTIWEPGVTIVDGPVSLAVPENAAEGDYFVHVGLYDMAGDGARCLDVYCPTILRVSRTAKPSSAVGPNPLSASEVQKRRGALADRIERRNRVTLDTQAWRFDVDRASGAWSLLDKTAEVLWTSSTTRPRFGRITLVNGSRREVCRIDRFDDVASTPRSLRMVVSPLIDGVPSGVTVLFTVVPSPDFEGLQLAYATHATGPWKVESVRLLEDALQVTEEDEGAIYVPHRLGIEVAAGKGLPSQQTWATYDGLSMAMCGAVKQGAILLLSWDQVDSRLTAHTTWPNSPLVAGRRAVSVSLDLNGPENTCLIQPLGRGNYVDLARAYRPIAQAKGWRKTWAEKREQFPTVDMMFGAANFKPFVLSRALPSSRYSKDGKEVVHLGFTFDEVAQCAEHWRNELQIDRAFVVMAGWINAGYDVRHPDVLPAAPECGGNEGLAAAAQRIRACGYLFGLHDNYQDMYEDAPSWGQTWLNKDSRGVARKGGNWNGGQAWQVCAVKQVELAARPETNLPAIETLFAPTIYFIDTVFAWPLVTCEDPAHPMSRHDDLFWKTNLCLLAKKHFGLFGSEEGREWSVPCADYLEGIFGHQTDSPTGQVIPLFPIVYSDCVQIMTHQGNRIAAGDDKKVADHILFAEMFLPSFGQHLYWQQGGDESSNDLWSRGDGGWGAELVRTDRVIKNVWEVLSPLNRITAELPLDDHKFLTPDRLVQQTRFGDVTITVAFGQPATVGDHQLPANGFVVESPRFVAFCATRYNGVQYSSPTLFTAESRDGRLLTRSTQVRIYHGFGDPQIRLGEKDFEVAREEIVSCQ